MKKLCAALRKKDGMAMVIVLCVMALTMVLCLALLLNASVMMQSAINQKNRQQARVLSETLSDQIHKDLTQTRSGFFWTIANDIVYNGWPDYEKDVDGHAMEDALRTYSVSKENMPVQMQQALSTCSVSMYWVKEAQAQGQQQITRTLFVTVSCTYKGQTSSLTQSYVATAGNANTNWLPWENTGRGTAAQGGAAA